MSDSDSSDDDLLTGAVFTRKRPNRRQTAAATKRINHLDDLCSRQEELLGRQARMEESIKKQEEPFVPDEKDELDLDLGFDVMRSGGDKSKNGINDDGSPLGTCTKEVTYDIDDPSYWSKIEDLQKKNSKEKQKKLRTGIDGFDMKNEFGSNDNQETKQTEEERERLAAEISGRHSNLGTRRTFGWFHQNDNHEENENTDMGEEGDSYLVPFSSLKEVTDELNSMFKKYDRAPMRGLNADGRQKWNSIRNEIIKKMKKAHGLDILPQMLGRRWNPDLIIPLDLLIWLTRVATSGMMVTGTELCLGAFTMAQTIFEAKMEIIYFDGGKSVRITEVINIADFIPLLTTNYGLWKAKCGSALSSSPNAMAIKNVEPFDEPSGLEHALRLFNVAIANDMAKFPSDIDDAQKILSQMIATLLCAGLDPIFYAGHSLLEHQGNILQTLIERVYKGSKDSIESSENNTKVSNEFISGRRRIESVAELAMEFCCEQFMKLPKADDEDKEDREGWMCIELMIRSWQTIQKKESILILYSSLCNLALMKCMGDICNWDAELQKSALAMMNTAKIKNITGINSKELLVYQRFKALAMAEIALGMITKQASSIIRDGPRLLATIRIAEICQQIGIEFFVLNIQFGPTISQNRGFCESDSEAIVLYEHFDHLCNVFQNLKNSIRVIANPNMRRAKELVILLLGFYGKSKTKVSYWDKSRKTEKRRQSSLSSMWFKEEEE